MDATQLIKDNLDVERVLEYFDFDKVHPSGNKLRACCKIHDGNNDSSFVIDAETGLWSCHTGSCGSGDMFHLVQRLEKISFPMAVVKLADILGIDINNLDIVARTKQERLEVRTFLDAIKNAQPKELEAYTPIGKAVNVTKYRGFQSSTIKHFGLKYFKTFEMTDSEDKTYTITDRLGFPLYQYGKQVGVSLRATKKGEKSKWIHQPANIKTRELLYNYENVIGELEVVVVEGITDVWAYYEIGIPAVATYGAHITKEQIRLLLMLGSDLTFSFDGDKTGQEAMTKAEEIFRLTSNIRFVILDDKQDPESIPREELKVRYDTKRHYPIQSNA